MLTSIDKAADELLNEFDSTSLMGPKRTLSDDASKGEALKR